MPLKELNYTVVVKKHEMGEIVIGKKQCCEFMEHRVLQCFLSIFFLFSSYIPSHLVFLPSSQCSYITESIEANAAATEAHGCVSVSPQ